ncbi:MAG: outer membrane protein assembly factor BamA [Pseudomonadota bacterium]
MENYMKYGGKIAAAVIAFSVLGALALPAVSFAGGGAIQSIEFVGNRRTPSETIKTTVKTSAGQSLDVQSIDRDIKALYGLGQFSDIRVESDPAPGGIKLKYIFEEKPVVAEIDFSGNRKIKSDDLRKDTTQRTFSVLDQRAIAETIEKIRAAYAKKGYYLADVDYHIESTEEGESKLVFDIHEHQGVSVRRVLFIGNKVYKDKELRGVIKTQQKNLIGFLTGAGKYEEEMLRNDALMLTYFYLNHGYLKVKASPPKVTISKDKRYIFVTFQVHEGSQYKIGKIGISGDVLTTQEELTALLKTKKGETYSQKTLEEDVMALTERYGDEGYAYASINPDTAPDDEKLTADIDIRIGKGKRIKVERINISGNATTRDKVIRREMELMENDRFSERLLRKSREKLMKLGYFEEVNFATPRGSRDDTMVLNVTVKEKPTGSFNISAGFSTYENFIFNASVQKENFFGYGVSGQLSAELSSKRQLFMLSANDPYFLGSQWSAGFSGYRNGFAFTDFTRIATGGDVSVGHRFLDNFSAQLTYQLEKVQVSDFNYIVPQVFRQNASGVTSELNLAFARDSRDNRITPHKGLYTTLTQEVSGTKLGGTNDFYRINCRNMFYYPIWKSLIFQQFARIGYIKSLNNQLVPLYERFFTGGSNSLRGYFPNSVGPKVRIPASTGGGVTDFVYGGNKLMLFLTELEIPIYDKGGIRGVVFFDAGNTYAENENYSFANLRTDYGFGIRWNSPMGPLRFEWGFPIARRPGEDPVQFNFTIGNYF